MAAANREEEPYKKKMRVMCELPDEILIRILSLLPTQSAVATSILSRRWRYLWTFITNIQFHEDTFNGRNEFINFVDRVLALRDGSSSLVSYSLKFKVQLCDAYRVSTWLTPAIQSNVRRLSLYLQDDNTRYFYSVPPCVFRCQSLVEFDLRLDHRKLGIPSSICLSNLKYLRFTGLRFVDTEEEEEEKLLSFPLLEELIMDRCDWGSIKGVRVDAPKLQVVKIVDNRAIPSKYNTFADVKVRIVGDNINNFSYSGGLLNEYSICGSTMQLREAVTWVGWHHDHHPDWVSMDVVAAQRCYKLINGLSKVQNLTLTEHFLEYLEHITELLDDTIPTFGCLTQLNLDCASGTFYIDSMMLMKILERCPHLEHLNFVKDLDCYALRGELSLTKASCFRTHLKTITIQSYPSGNNQDGLISSLLNSAHVLEEVVVYGDSSKIQELLEK